jgi:N-acetylneuraminic acid mutarotase
LSKSVVMLLVLVFLVASCLVVAKPAFSTADVAENTWTPKASLPDGVSIVKAAVVNGKIYAMTGSSNYEYDPTTDNWTAKTPMPTPRSGVSFGIASCQNKIYVIGGENETNEYHIDYLSTNEVYDPSTDSWETKKSMHTSREWVEANVVDDKIYVISGETDNYHSVRTPANEVYDPATDSWNTKQPIPYAVIKGASAVVDNKIYLLGGLFNSSDPLNAVYNQIYDTETDTWSFGASLPTGMWYIAAGATAGVMAPKRIYVMGGGFTEVTNVVNVYDPALDVWSAGAPLPTNCTGHAVAVVNDLLYAIGGGSDWHGGEPGTPGAGWTLTSVVEQYTPFGYETIPHSTPEPEPEPFPVVPVAAASIATVAVVGVGLLVFKKRNH